MKISRAVFHQVVRREDFFRVFSQMKDVVKVYYKGVKKILKVMVFINRLPALLVFPVEVIDSYIYYR